MSEFYEVDFLDVKSPKSGDAIPLRYRTNGTTYVHVVDGGYQATGEDLVAHVRKHYGSWSGVDHVVVTHPDGDHAGGLRIVLEELSVGALWMLRPWLYAQELIARFPTYQSVERLTSRLRALYENIAALEEIAVRKGIPIYEPFQGAHIGEFVVLAPTRARYLDLVVASEKTPETDGHSRVATLLQKAGAKAVQLIRAAWGQEVFSSESTSSENEMSIVQYAELCGDRILLTGDVGRGGLAEAADYAQSIGIPLPGIDKFQVPHHGSRRNVSSELLDRWLGPRMETEPLEHKRGFSAFVSSGAEDEKHPRRAVVRAVVHRGGQVYATRGKDLRTSRNAPERAGWGQAERLPYPSEQDE